MLNKANPSKMRGKLGFTLVEVLIVMAILTTMTGFAVMASFSNFREYSFRSERDILVSVLYKVRNQAVNNVCLGASCTNGKPSGVAFPPLAPAGKYIIFQGPNFAERDVAIDEVLTPSYAINIAGPSEIVFSNLSGNPTPSQIDLTVADNMGNSSVISINSEGRIIWTN